MSDSYLSVSIDEAHELCRAALIGVGVAEEHAKIVAAALVRSEMDGQVGHGLSRVPSYVLQVQAGKVNLRARPRLEHAKPGLLRIDADFGFAFPAIAMVLPELASLAKTHGIGAASIYHSHHFGVAGHPCEDLATMGLVSFLYGNAPKAIAPTGSSEKVLGTNPIAFAAPHLPHPLVVDFAVSTVARGKILAARQQGRQIPVGWALGPDGEQTTDPEIALQGSMVPIGGAKGAALALIVEVMSACLAGAALGVEASSLFDGEGGPPDLGQVLIAIDPGPLSRQLFSDRMAALATVYENIDGARFPGESRLAKRETAKKHGLTVPASLVQAIKNLTKQP
jgi:(2R)-3-sulfolactate dehydrogenase (NADP+)